MSQHRGSRLTPGGETVSQCHGGMYIKPPKCYKPTRDGLPIECKISIDAFRSVLIRDWALWNSTTAAAAIFPIQNLPTHKPLRRAPGICSPECEHSGVCSAAWFPLWAVRLLAPDNRLTITIEVRTALCVSTVEGRVFHPLGVRRWEGKMQWRVQGFINKEHAVRASHDHQGFTHRVNYMNMCTR